MENGADGPFGHPNIISNAGKSTPQGFPLDVLHQPPGGPSSVVHIR
jgi:hypothetical protein